MAQHKLLCNFTGGEISPLLDARIDLAKYDSSCRTMENMRPIMHGGAAFRAGTLFIAKAKYNNKQCRLIPFNYSTAVTYVVEMGHLYMRFFSGTGVAVAITSGSAAFWSYTGSYTAGTYVQWQGVVYICTVNVAPAILYGTPPNLDATHWTAQTAYEISSPFTEAELFAVQFLEINDVVYLVHPNHPPQKLTRTSAVTFTLAAVSWKYPALTDENIDGVTTMTVGALTGATTLTCSAARFNANMVGAYFEVRHLKDAVSDTIDLSGSAGTITGTALEVQGDWTVTTTQRWYGSLTVERSIDGGSTWQVARKVTSKSDSNPTFSGTEVLPNLGRPRVQLRLKYTASGDPYGTPPWVGAVPTAYVKATAVLEATDAYVAGLVQCTSYVSTTVLNVTVVQKMGATTASALWSESEWDGSRGYPGAIGLYEQRVIYARTATRPTTIWGSVAGDFDNFQYSDLDDAAVAYQPATAQQNPVQWLEALQAVAAGTSGEELKMASGNQDEALTPANVTIRTSSNIGSEPVMPVKIGSSILFVQRQGKRIREYIEQSPYSTQQQPDPSDVTILAEHIFAGGIVEMDHARLPDPQVYAVLSNGTLAVMAFSKEQNVNGWARYVTGNSTDPHKFESVAVVYGTPADVVFVVVQRTLDGVISRNIECFTAEGTDKQNSIYGMDATVVIQQDASTTVKVGDPATCHLNGKYVAVVADGVNYGNTYAATFASGTDVYAVVAGVLTLPYPVTNVRVGLPYWGTLLPQKLDSMVANGTSQGRYKRITAIAVRMKDTLGLQYGNSKTPLSSSTLLNYSDEAVFRSASDAMDAAPPLFTGDMVLPWNGGNELAGDLMLSQIQPFPMTILGIFTRHDVLGD